MTTEMRCWSFLVLVNDQFHDVRVRFGFGFGFWLVFGVRSGLGWVWVRFEFSRALVRAMTACSEVRQRIF